MEFGMYQICEQAKAELEKTKVLLGSLEKALSKVEATKEEIIDSGKITTLDYIFLDIYKFNYQLQSHNDWLSKLKTLDMSYRQADPSLYQENYQSSCIIVNVVKNSDVIHIYDIINTKNYTKFFSLLYTNFKNNSYKCTRRLPLVDEVFGIVLNNCFYRAVRNNKVENDHCLAVLIDHGNIVRFPINAEFYLLPPEIQSEPSMAIRCKVVNNDKMNQILENCVHKKYMFYVEKNNGDIIEISLKRLETNPFSNPFYETELDENERKWFHCNYIEENKNINVVAECNEIKEPNLDKNGPPGFFKSFTIRPHVKKLSREYLHECFTNNYEHEFSEELFKLRNDNETVGNENSRKEEQPLRFLKNLAENSHESKCVQFISKSLVIGANIFVLPTHMLNVTTFYGQVIKNESSLTALSQLQLQLNEPFQISKFSKFTIENLPKKFDLVLARFTDELFYRAQIVQENFDEFKVFYLDYGNDLDLHYSDLRMWEKQFEYLPFQAVKFQLNAIVHKIHPKNNEDIAIQAEYFLTKNFLNKKFLAKIIKKKGELVIVAISSPNFKCPSKDLSDLLVIKNYATLESKE